jgi:hypothetical protein
VRVEAVKRLFITLFIACHPSDWISLMSRLHRVRALLVHQFGRMHQMAALRWIRLISGRKKGA